MRAVGVHDELVESLACQLGPPCIPESRDHEGWLRHRQKIDPWGVSPQELADRAAGVAA